MFVIKKTTFCESKIEIWHKKGSNIEYNWIKTIIFYGQK